MNKIKKTAQIVLLLTLVASINVFAQKEEVTPAPEPVTREIITTVINGRIRKGSNTKSEIVKELPLGTRLMAVSEANGWDEVYYGEPDSEGKRKTVWISKTITTPYDSAKPGVQAQKIADKYFKMAKMDFATAVQLYEFLPGAADRAKTYEVGGDLRLKSIKALNLALRAVPFDKSESNPYKAFLDKNKDMVVYSEPAGEWYVVSEKIWQLHERYRKHKVGEEIAWTAASNSLPGECEGYINCYLYMLRIREAEYLNFYPNGKHSLEALGNIKSMLEPIVADAKEKTVYYTTNDISDRAEFNSTLVDLRKIVSKSPHVEKQDVLKQIQLIADGYR
ncbi:MAG: hypothetical protein R2684_16130 [Pyrinomonadaceae bacterium]